ncbi:MAG: SRPBCC domain-containing protein [Alphaproteobacteria bacterium]
MTSQQPKKQPNVTVSVSRHFDQPAEKVFDAWLDPKTAGKWLFSTPTGKMVKVEIEARPGGHFTFTDRRDGEDIEHTGQYEVINCPRQIVFTFGVPKFTGKEVTRVLLDFVPAGKGCDLTLTHEGVWADYAERTKEGWGKILAGLAGELG